VEQAVFDVKAAFKTALDDGLNLHHFWPALFKFIKQVNHWTADNALSGAAAKACLDELKAIDTILAILDPAQMPVPLGDLPGEVQGMVADRRKAREAKDFGLSDELRDKIAAAGFRVEDTGGAPRVFKA
jgi:cysteinyl-tRNA synthetase